MEILYLDSIDSTHLFLEKSLKNNTIKAPIAVVANRQLGGIGSNGNRWDSLEGNLFLSFAITKESLPKDLKLESSSIYFSMLLREVLVELGSNIWVKWPNDLYIDDKKVGGVITKVVLDHIIICSIGLNLKNAPVGFKTVDIKVKKNRLIELFFLKIKEDILWKKIFSIYEIEFKRSKGFSFYDKTLKKRLYLKDAILNSDGSITVENRKVYSLR